LIGGASGSENPEFHAPDPSPARLQAIASACNAPTAATRLLTARMSDSSVQAFASAIEALPDSALPPACEADLLAVAAALAAG
jgi:hypothetical protein